MVFIVVLSVTDALICWWISLICNINCQCILVWCRSVVISICEDAGIGDWTILFGTRIPWSITIPMTILWLVARIFHLYSLVPFASDTFNFLTYAKGVVIVKVDIQGSERQLGGFNCPNPYAVFMSPVLHDTVEYCDIFYDTCCGVRALVSPNSILDCLVVECTTADDPVACRWSRFICRAVACANKAGRIEVLFGVVILGDFRLIGSLCISLKSKFQTWDLN